MRVFRYFQIRIHTITGQKLDVLDLRDSYTLADVETLFTAMQAEGRAVCTQLVIFDFFFPFVYGTFFVLVLAFFIKRIFPKQPKRILFALFPLSIIPIDYIENFNTLRLLAAYPNLSPEKVAFASQITSIKHILVASSLILCTLGLIVFFGKKILQRKT